MANNCQICKRTVPTSEGYLLTTRQIVSSREFCLRMFAALPTELRADAAIKVIQEERPWYVCENCISMFKVNRASARQHAERWLNYSSYRMRGCGSVSIKDMNLKDKRTGLKVFGVLAVLLVIFGGIQIRGRYKEQKATREAQERAHFRLRSHRGSYELPRISNSEHPELILLMLEQMALREKDERDLIHDVQRLDEEFELDEEHQIFSNMKDRLLVMMRESNHHTSNQGLEDILPFRAFSCAALFSELLVDWKSNEPSDIVLHNKTNTVTLGNRRISNETLEGISLQKTIKPTFRVNEVIELEEFSLSLHADVAIEPEGWASSRRAMPRTLFTGTSNGGILTRERPLRVTVRAGNMNIAGLRNYTTHISDVRVTPFTIKGRALEMTEDKWRACLAAGRRSFLAAPPEAEGRGFRLDETTEKLRFWIKNGIVPEELFEKMTDDLRGYQQVVKDFQRHFQIDRWNRLSGKNQVAEALRTWLDNYEASLRRGERHLAISPEGSKVLTGSDDGTDRPSDAATGEAIRTFSGHTNSVRSVAFSFDGSKVLTGSYDGTARMWNAATGEHIRTFTGHTGDVNTVAFSPDGSQVLTGSDDRTARLWNAATGETIRTFTGHTNTVWSVAFSPDGSQVLTGSDDRTARLWNAAKGEHIRTFTGHTGDVNTVDFSPDGSQVLTGSNDRTAGQWNTATGEHLRTFSGHTGWILSVAFSPDGSKVLTGSGDNTARLWE